MTTSLPAVMPAGPSRGSQTPRICSLPAFSASSGAEAVDLAARAGLVLDPWQRLVLDGALGERPDGSWAAREVGLVVGRQNGKGSIIEARELAGLFLFGERLILHTAHQFKTAHEGFLRIKALIEGRDEFTRRVKRIISSTQGEMIEMTSGQRLMFIARSVNGSGRGFSCDGPLFFDEAMRLPSEAVAALLPTQAAQPNPQTWYLASAGFRDSDVLRRLRERGIEATSSRLAYFEWSAEPDCDPLDRHAWATANPAFGIRMTEEGFEAELVLDPEDFARERLGIWASNTSTLFGPGAWEGCRDPVSSITSRCVFAVDVTPNRDWASIGVAGLREDRRMHGEVVEHRPGTAWIAERLVELVKKHRPKTVVVDRMTGGPLVPTLEQAKVPLTVVGSGEVSQACGQLFDLVTQNGFHHIGQPDLDAAVASACRRSLGDGYAWDRKNSDGDISPLVAVTLATWVAASLKSKPKLIDLAALAAAQENTDAPPLLP